jgi:DNA-binding beta-propeller fold protein YncE
LLLTGAGTTGYDLVNASYSGKSFNVAGQDTVPTHTAFNTNGTKMYVTGLITDTVYQYSLSTAFEVNTASYDSVSFSVASQMNNPRGTVFNTDGTKMYIVDGVNLSVYQYSLSTAFDLSTASYDSVSFSVASQENSPFDLAFNNAGTKMYVTGQITDSVYQYSLSTAFDLSTASYDSVSFSVASQALIPYSIAFNPTGSKMFILDNNTKNVFQYSLSTAFNLSTASYDTVSFTITQMTNPVGMVFNTNGTKMYVVGTSNDTIYQYSTASPATITYDPDLQWPSGTAPTSPAIGETDVITFNTTDGGTTYKSVQSIDGAK